MASIKVATLKSGKKRYRVRVRYRGRYRSGTFTNRREAERFAVGIERHADLDNQSAPVQAAGRTFAELVDKYERTVQVGKRSTTQGSQRCQLHFWREWFSGQRLADVDAEQISQAKEAAIAEGMSVGTWNRYQSLLASILRHGARELGWLVANPADNVSRFREPPGRVRSLSRGEQQRLLLMVKASTCRHLYPIVLLALATGARRSEIATLCWDDVDLAYQRADGRMVGRIIIGARTETKNGDRKTCYLCGPALAVMQSVFRQRDTGKRHCFPRRTADLPVDFRHAWSVAVQRARLDDFRFHDLRHTAASWLAMSGGTERDIAELLGHRSPASSRRYTHLVESHTIAMTQRLANQLGGRPRHEARA